jgi:8-oxo-dGTP pyrophosphatase MutT (NUDIX family)
MEATFNEITYYQGEPQVGGRKTIHLPFARVSARALIVRQRDGSILGVLHRPDGRFALPGGGVDAGEAPPDALLRELAEENIVLAGLVPGWEEQFGVDYFPGYRELNLWYVLLVDDVQTSPSPEIVAYRWVPQTEDPWYPGMLAQIMLLINRYLPKISQAVVEVNGARTGEEHA